MDCIVHAVAKSQTRLRDFHFTIEKSHKNILSMTGRRFSQRINTSANAWRMDRGNIVSVSESRSVVADSATSWTVTRQAPLSLQFSRQEFWSGLPFPSPLHRKDSPNQVKIYGVFKLSKKLAESKEARGTAAQLARLVPGKFVFSVLSRTKFINKYKQTKIPNPNTKIIRRNDWCGP